MVEGCALQVEVNETRRERQLGDRELVFDRAYLLLVDFGIEQIEDDTLRFTLALRMSPDLM